MPETTDPFEMFNLPETVEPEAKPTDKPAATAGITLTQEQWDNMMTAQREERRRNQELMAQLFSGQPQPQATINQPELAIDLSGLPDPRDDLEGYHSGLAERLGRTVANVRNVVRQELTNEQAAANETTGLMNRAWDRFGELHSDLAGFPEVIETATTAVFNDLRQRGIDPMRLMQADLDDVVNRVAERSQATVDRIRGANTEVAGGRTAMLGGQPAKPRGKPADTAPKPDDFVADLKKLQAQMRLY